MRTRHGAMAVVAAALAAGYALAAPPEVPKELKADPGQLLRIVVKAKDVGYLRNFGDDEAFFGELVSPVEGERHFVFQPPATKAKPQYVLGWWTPGEKAGAATTITVGAAPAPGPAPDPKPKPDPTPVTTQKLFIVIVEETEDGVAARGQMLADPTLARRMKDKGHKWRVVDKDAAGADGAIPADVRRFLEAAAGKAYPQVFLVGQKGETVYSGDLPKTPAGLIDLLQKNGG